MKTSTHAITYEGNTLTLTLSVTAKGKPSKSGKSLVHDNVNGSKDFPTMMTSEPIDSKYVEGADENRDYFVVGGVWSVAKKEEKPKSPKKAKAKKSKAPDFSGVTLKDIQKIFEELQLKAK